MPFPSSDNLNKAYLIRAIPSQDFILIGILTSTINQVLVYRLSTYAYITTMDFDIQ